MRTILHLRTRPEDELNRDLLARQQGLPETTVEVIDLTQDVDYGKIVEKLFAADSIHVI